VPKIWKTVFRDNRRERKIPVTRCLVQGKEKSMKCKYMKTLSGLLFAGADQAPQDFTTPLFIDTV